MFFQVFLVACGLREARFSRYPSGNDQLLLRPRVLVLASSEPLGGGRMPRPCEHSWLSGVSHPGGGFSKNTDIGDFRNRERFGSVYLCFQSPNVQPV